MTYFQFDLRAYLPDTAHLSLLDHGVYVRLLTQYYNKETPILDVDRYRTVGARTDQERESVDAVLREFFYRDGEFWRQTRADKEIEAYHNKSEKARASAARRWVQMNGEPCQYDADAMLGDCERIESADANEMRTHSERIASADANAMLEGMRTPCQEHAKSVISSSLEINSKEPIGLDSGISKGRKRRGSPVDPGSSGTVIRSAADAWAKFCEIYPRRSGSQRKPEAEVKFKAAIRQGVDPEIILAKVREYRAFCDAEGKTGTSLVAQMATWVNGRRWKDDCLPTATQSAMPVSDEIQHRKKPKDGLDYWLKADDDGQAVRRFKVAEDGTKTTESFDEAEWRESRGLE